MLAARRQVGPGYPLVPGVPARARTSVHEAPVHMYWAIYMGKMVSQTTELFILFIASRFWTMMELLL